jgi:hypothetical protein
MMAVAIGAVVWAGASRASAPVKDKPASPPQAALDQNFDVRIGGTVTITGESLPMTFETVAEDSRCPTNITCIWAGDAVVRVTVVGANAERATLNLRTGTAVREAGFQHYRVRLVQLLPAPEDTQASPPQSTSRRSSCRRTSNFDLPRLHVLGGGAGARAVEYALQHECL